MTRVTCTGTSGDGEGVGPLGRADIGLHDPLRLGVKARIDEERRLIVASAPVLQKGKMRGTVETVSSLNLLASLVSTNDLGQPHEFLLGDDGEVLLPIEREVATTR